MSKPCAKNGRSAASASQIVPPLLRDALMRAAQRHDMAEIDAITDALARQGLVRPRSECTWLTKAELGHMLAGTRGV